MLGWIWEYVALRRTNHSLYFLLMQFFLCVSETCVEERQSTYVEQNRLIFGDFWKYAGFFFQIQQERETLPVKNFESEILDAICHNSVVVIRGATGCGKTTQVPQYILDEYIKTNRAAECNIVVTQVRNMLQMQPLKFWITC